MQKKPKIAILGYGNMGKEIERLALEQGYVITDIFDFHTPIKADVEYDFDVAIDFTYPQAVFDNTRKLAKQGKNIVLGTTGWYSEKDKLSMLVESNNIGLVWGSNFSIGMQMFFRLTKVLGKLANKVPEYDVFLHEYHHTQKKDSPSGTALSLANILLGELERKDKIETGRVDGEIASNALHLSSTRGGSIPGTHTITVDSKSDFLEISHIARNREGFASGSLVAADWIWQKKGFFDFNETLDELWADIKL